MTTDTAVFRKIWNRNLQHVSESLIAKEQPREDTRLRGSGLIEPCVIVPAYSNVRQHLWCNSEQRMHCFWANMWYRIHEPCVCANPLIRCDLLTKSSVKILPESEAKILLLRAKSKIWAQKWMNSQSTAVAGLNPKSRQKYFQNLPIHSPIRPSPWGTIQGLGWCVCASCFHFLAQSSR